VKNVSKKLIFKNKIIIQDHKYRKNKKLNIWNRIRTVDRVWAQENQEEEAIGQREVLKVIKDIVRGHNLMVNSDLDHQRETTKEAT
jgi:hypothetical protein